jgi:hypothetical protein
VLIVSDRGERGYLRRALAAGPLLVLLSSLPISRLANAEGMRDANQPLVILTEHGDRDAEDNAFFSSVRALAAEIGLEVTTRDVPTFQSVRDALLAEARSQRKPFLVTWILRDGRLRQIHLFDPWKNQLRTRSIEVGTSATASAESLALILRAELVAYLGEQPPSPSPPPPPSPPPAPRAPDARWAATAAYSLGTFVRGQGLLQGARLGAWHTWGRLRLAAVYGLFSEQQIAGQGAVVTLNRHPVELDLGYASREHYRLRWGADAFVCGDWISRHTISATSPLSPQPDAGHLLISIGGRARQELRLFRNLAIGLGVGLEIPLNSIELQVLRGTTAETVARLSSIRFIANLGIEILL